LPESSRAVSPASCSRQAEGTEIMRRPQELIDERRENTRVRWRQTAGRGDARWHAGASVAQRWQDAPRRLCVNLLAVYAHSDGVEQLWRGVTMLSFCYHIDDGEQRKKRAARRYRRIVYRPEECLFAMIYAGGARYATEGGTRFTCAANSIRGYDRDRGRT